MKTKIKVIDLFRLLLTDSLNVGIITTGKDNIISGNPLSWVNRKELSCVAARSHILSCQSPSEYIILVQISHPGLVWLGSSNSSCSHVSPSGSNLTGT